MKKTGNLNLKQQLFISYYADPNQNTFGNGLQSYKKAYKIENTDTAKSNASRLLSKAYINKAINEEFHNTGMDFKVSLSMLSRIIIGDFTESNLIMDSDGKKSITIKTPSAGAVLKAISVIDKLTK